MGTIEEIMKKDGWVLGRTENCGVEYWSFRRDDIEIALRDIDRVDPLDNRSSGHFKKWRKDSP